MYYLEYLLGKEKMSKTEERLKKLVDECFQEKREKLDQEVSANISFLVIFGIFIGSLMTYISLFPVVLGIVAGIYISKIKSQLTDYFIIQLFSIINQGRYYLSLTSKFGRN